MPTYTVCGEILELSKIENRYYFNLLLYFVQENEHKICLDENDFIIKMYKEIAKDNVDIHCWIKWLSYDKRNFEIIRLRKKPNSDKELFVLVCASTFDKLLIARKKEDYIPVKKLIIEEQIKLYDKDEIINIFSQTKCISIIAKGEKSTINAGDITIK